MVVSPYSVANALALLMQGADGKTLDQMEKTMHLSGDKAMIANQFMEYFKTNDTNRNESLLSANRLYIQNGYQIRQKFSDTIMNQFHSDIINIDFAKSTESASMINAFVQNKTNNRIMDIIKADSLNGNTRLVGVNAIYFKDNWKIAFHKERTFKGDFYSDLVNVVPVEFMRSVDDFRYANHHALDARAIALDFNNSNFMFVVILPNTRDGLPALEMKLTNYDLKEITKLMHITEVDVTLPKFKIDFELDLNDILKEVKNIIMQMHDTHSVDIKFEGFFLFLQLGMTDMFTDAANFTDLLTSSERLHVSNVVHKASIEVNEDGAEAAAATGRHSNQGVYFCFQFLLIYL